MMTTTGRQRGRSARLVAIGLAALLAMTAPSGARQLLVDGSVSAHVADLGFCEAEPMVEVRGPAAAFQGDRFALYRIIAILGSIVPAECPPATAMRVLGIADGTPVWQGRVSLPDGAITEWPQPDPDARIPLERGAMVAEIQAALNARGYAAGPVDGLMGPSTAAAIRAFQRTQGRPIDGRPDPGLVRALRDAPRPSVADADAAPVTPPDAAPPGDGATATAAAPSPPEPSSETFPEPPPPGTGQPGAPIPLDELAGEGPGRALPGDLVLTPDPGGPVLAAPEPAGPVPQAADAPEGPPATAAPEPGPSAQDEGAEAGVASPGPGTGIADPDGEPGPPVGRLLMPFRFAGAPLAPGPVDQATATAALARSVAVDGGAEEGATLTFDDGTRERVTTCDGWSTARNRGGVPATTAAWAIAGRFVRTCDPLIALSAVAAPPDRAALLAAPVPPLDPAAWSAALAPALSGDQERRRAELAAGGASLADIAEPGSVETGPGTLSVTWRGMRRTLAPRALAQTDADPAIEVLVHVADRAVGGSHRHHALIAVDRDPATGQYRPD